MNCEKFDIDLSSWDCELPCVVPEEEGRYCNMKNGIPLADGKYGKFGLKAPSTKESQVKSYAMDAFDLTYYGCHKGFNSLPQSLNKMPGPNADTLAEAKVINLMVDFYGFSNKPNHKDDNYGLVTKNLKDGVLHFVDTIVHAHRWIRVSNSNSNSRRRAVLAWGYISRGFFDKPYGDIPRIDSPPDRNLIRMSAIFSKVLVKYLDNHPNFEGRPKFVKFLKVIKQAENMTIRSKHGKVISQNQGDEDHIITKVMREVMNWCKSVVDSVMSFMKNLCYKTLLRELTKSFKELLETFKCSMAMLFQPSVINLVLMVVSIICLSVFTYYIGDICRAMTQALSSIKYCFTAFGELISSACNFLLGLELNCDDDPYVKENLDKVLSQFSTELTPDKVVSQGGGDLASAIFCFFITCIGGATGMSRHISDFFVKTRPGSTIVDWVTNNIRDIVNATMFAVSGSPYFKEPEIFEEISRIVAKVNVWRSTRGFDHEVKVDAQLAQEVIATSERAFELLTKVSKLPGLEIREYNLFKDCCLHLITLTELANVSEALNKPRVSPAWIHFVGKTGNAKTALQNLIFSSVKTELKKKFDNSDYNVPDWLKYEGVAPADVCNWNQASEYAEGYSNQPFVVIDELFAQKESVTRGKMGAALLGMINTMAYPLNMASLSKKGGTFFDSALVYSTTNQLALTNIGLESPGAVGRRMSLPFEVMLKPGVDLLEPCTGFGPRGGCTKKKTCVCWGSGVVPSSQLNSAWSFRLMKPSNLGIDPNGITDHMKANWPCPEVVDICRKSYPIIFSTCPTLFEYVNNHPSRFVEFTLANVVEATAAQMWKYYTDKGGLAEVLSRTVVTPTGNIHSRIISQMDKGKAKEEPFGYMSFDPPERDSVMDYLNAAPFLRSLERMLTPVELAIYHEEISKMIETNTFDWDELASEANDWLGIRARAYQLEWNSEFDVKKLDPGILSWLKQKWYSGNTLWLPSCLDVCNYEFEPRCYLPGYQYNPPIGPLTGMLTEVTTERVFIMSTLCHYVGKVVTPTYESMVNLATSMVLSDPIFWADAICVHRDNVLLKYIELVVGVKFEDPDMEFVDCLGTQILETLMVLSPFVYNKCCLEPVSPLEFSKFVQVEAEPQAGSSKWWGIFKWFCLAIVGSLFLTFMIRLIMVLGQGIVGFVNVFLAIFGLPPLIESQSPSRNKEAVMRKPEMTVVMGSITDIHSNMGGENVFKPLPDVNSFANPVLSNLKLVKIIMKSGDEMHGYMQFLNAHTSMTVGHPMMKNGDEIVGVHVYTDSGEGSGLTYRVGVHFVTELLVNTEGRDLIRFCWSILATAGIKNISHMLMPRRSYIHSGHVIPEVIRVSKAIHHGGMVSKHVHTFHDSSGVVRFGHLDRIRGEERCYKEITAEWYRGGTVTKTPIRDYLVVINAKGQAGDCTIPYLSPLRGPYTEYKGKLLGAHVASTGNDAIVCPYYLDDLRDPSMKSTWPFKTDGNLVRFDHVIESNLSYESLVPTLPGVDYVGTSSESTRILTDTEFRESPFNEGTNEQIEQPLVAPALLKPIYENGKYIDPFARGLKFLNSQNREPSAVLRQYLTEPILVYSGFYEGPTEQCRELTMIESIVGVPELGIDPLDHTASVGLCECLEGKGLTGKNAREYLYTLNEDGSLDYLNPEFVEEVDNYHRIAESGMVKPMRAKIEKKDELRDLERVSQGKTRLFFVGNRAHCIFIKQQFGHMCKVLKKHWVLSACSVGCNPHSIDWSLVYDRVLKFPNAFAMDASAYDASEEFNWLILFFHFSNDNFYRYTPGSKAYVKLWSATQSLFCFLFKFGKNWYQTIYSNPSGSWLTTLINSFVLHCLFKVTYLELRKVQSPECWIYKMEDNVALWCNGDDNCGSVSNKVATWFNMLTIASFTKKHFGVTFTGADKSFVEEPFCKLSDVSYLGRGFVKQPDGTLKAPLRWTAINGMLLWTRDPPGDLTIFKQNLETIVREMVHYPEEVYDEMVNKIMFYLRKHNLTINPRILTYDSLMRRRENTYNGDVDYLNTSENHYSFW